MGLFESLLRISLGVAIKEAREQEEEGAGIATAEGIAAGVAVLAAAAVLAALVEVTEAVLPRVVTGEVVMVAVVVEGVALVAVAVAAAMGEIVESRSGSSENLEKGECGVGKEE